MTTTQGVLYIVATPIGNLDDISSRALRTLSEVDLIAVEDSRHSAKLLRHYGIDRPLQPLHDHNERAISDRVVGRVLGGESVALISDAGTPLISDPGYHLTRAAHQAGVRVVPIPGPSAVTSALCASGIATDQFLFVGFPPAKTVARRALYQQLADEPRTLVLYESPHRIIDSLEDLVEQFGGERVATLARELSKQFETIRLATLGELLEFVSADSNQQRGEFVIVVAAAPAQGDGEGLGAEVKRIAALLAGELPPTKAAALAAAITGYKRRLIYDYLLQE